MSVFQSESSLSWLQKSLLDDFGASESDLYQATKPEPVAPEGTLESTAKAPGRILSAAKKAFFDDVIANHAYIQQRIYGALPEQLLGDVANATGIAKWMFPGVKLEGKDAGKMIQTGLKQLTAATGQEAAIADSDRGVASFIGSALGGAGQFAVSPAGAITQMAAGAHRRTFGETGDDRAAAGSAIISGVLGVLMSKLGGAGGTVTKKTATSTVTSRVSTATALKNAAMVGGTRGAVAAAIRRTAKDAVIAGAATEIGVVVDEINKGVWTDQTTKDVLAKIKSRTPEAFLGALTQAAFTGYGQARGVFGAVKARGVLRDTIRMVDEALVTGKNPDGSDVTPEQRWKYEQAMGDYAATAKEHGWADIGVKSDKTPPPNPAREGYIETQLNAARQVYEPEVVSPAAAKPKPPGGIQPVKGELPAAGEKPKAPPAEPIIQPDGEVVAPAKPVKQQTHTEESLATASPADLRAAALNYDIFATGNESGAERKAVVAKIIQAQERRQELSDMLDEVAAMDAEIDGEPVAKEESANPDPEALITVETPEESITMTVAEAMARLDEIDASASAEQGGADEGALASAEAEAIRKALESVPDAPNKFGAEDDNLPPMIRRRVQAEAEENAPTFDQLPQAMKDEMINAGLMGKTGAGEVRDFFDKLPAKDRAEAFAEWQADMEAMVGAPTTPDLNATPTKESLLAKYDEIHSRPEPDDFDQLQANFEELANTADAIVRLSVGENGGKVDHADGTYDIISKNTDPAEMEKFPWRVTTFTKDGAGKVVPWGHTVHKKLDAPDSRGPYPDGAIQEAASNWRSRHAMAKKQPSATPAAPNPASVLAKAKLTVTKTQTKNGKDVWAVSGDTFPYKSALKELGGKWYGPKKEWSFYDGDPTAKIAERIANERSNTDVGLPGDAGVGESAARTPDRPSPVRTGSPPTDERIVTARWEYTPEPDRSVIPADVAKHLRPHQADATAMAWKAMHNDQRGAVIASGTGAGKTRSILAVAQMHMQGENRPVVIVAPNEVFGKPFANKGVVTGSYANDAKAMGMPFSLVKGDAKIEDGKLYYTTYDHFAKVKYPENAVLIFDEAHSLKNALATGSNRGVAGLGIIDRAHSVLFATATPADKAIHIPYLARAGVFEGHSQAAQLQRLGLREVIKGDPKDPRSKRFWMLQNGVTAEESLARIDDLFMRMTAAGKMIKHEISFKGLNVNITRLKLPPEAHETMANLEAAFGGGSGLAEALNLMHQRRQQEPYKVQAAADMVMRSIAAGRKPIVFLARVNYSAAEQKIRDENGDVVDIITHAESEGTAKLLKAELQKRGVTKIAELHGESETSAAEAMQQFQGGDAEAMIATVESGGTGINLDDVVGNAPRDLIVMTPPFSAVPFVQMLGRVWRLTTKSNPSFEVILGDTRVDDWNAAIINEKMNMLGATVSGEVGAMKMGDRPAVAPTQPAKPQAKQPWQMTRDEFVKANAKGLGHQARTNVTINKAMHRKAVVDAAIAGETIPPEVLADYPEVRDSIASGKKPTETTASGLPLTTATINALNPAAIKREAKARGIKFKTVEQAKQGLLDHVAAAAVPSSDATPTQRPSDDLTITDSGEQAAGGEEASAERVEAARVAAVRRGAIEQRLIDAHAERGTARDVAQQLIEAHNSGEDTSIWHTFAIDEDSLSSFPKMARVRAKGMGIVSEEGVAIRDLLGDAMFFQVADEILGGRVGKVRSAVKSILESPEMYAPQDVLDAYIASRWESLNLRQPEDRGPDFIGPTQMLAGEANAKREFVDPASLKPGDKMFIFGKPFYVGVDSKTGGLMLIGRAVKSALPIEYLTDIPVDGPVEKAVGASLAGQTTMFGGTGDAIIPEGESVGAITGSQEPMGFMIEKEPSALDREEAARVAAKAAEVDAEGQMFLDEHDPEDNIEWLHSGLSLPPSLQELLQSGGRFFLNSFVRDLMDVVQASDTPEGDALARDAERIVSQYKSAIGKLSKTRDPALRIAGRSIRGAWEVQQVNWNGDFGHAAFQEAIEGGFVPPHAVGMINAIRKFIDATGQMFAANKIQQYHFSVKDWRPFNYIPGGKVFPRLSDDNLIRLMMNGDTPNRQALINYIASRPRNAGTTVAKLTALFDAWGKDLREANTPGAQRRINAEYSREIKDFPTHMKDQKSGQPFQLIETNPFAFVRRLADNAAHRVSYSNVFGQATSTTTDRANGMIEAYGKATGNEAPARQLVRGLAGLPITDPPNVKPNTRRYAKNAMTTLGLMRDLMYSGSQPGNLLEVFGTLAAFNSWRDFVVALRRMMPDQAPAVLAYGRMVGSIINEFDNYTINPNDVLGSVVSALGATLRNTYKWANALTEDFSAALAQVKVDRIRAGKGTKGDVIDVMQKMGWDAARAKRFVENKAPAWEYNAYLRRAPTAELASNQSAAEMSSMSQGNRVYKAVVMAERFAQMRLRTMLDAFRTMDQARKSGDKGLFMAGVGKMLKAMGLLTATGLLTQFVTAWLVGGNTGAGIFLNELSDEPFEVAGEALLYQLLAGPFGGILRLNNSGDNLAEAAVRMTLPGFAFFELKDALSGGGSYKDMTEMQKAGRFFGRITPIAKPLAQAMAMFGIGGGDDPIAGMKASELNIDTVERSYWRWRFEEAPPSSGGDDPSAPTAADAAEKTKASQEFRYHMKQAYLAWRDGNDPQSEIDLALEVDGRNRSNMAASIRKRRFLADLTPEQKTSLLNRIGASAYSVLEDHDAILSGWAQSGTP